MLIFKNDSYLNLLSKYCANSQLDSPLKENEFLKKLSHFNLHTIPLSLFPSRFLFISNWQLALFVFSMVYSHFFPTDFLRNHTLHPGKRKENNK